jgi:hypothetical protein
VPGIFQIHTIQIAEEEFACSEGKGYDVAGLDHKFGDYG